MSLMHLLAVGRSIGTIRDQPTRYKMTQQNLLPRFGPAKEEQDSGPAMLERERPRTENLAGKEHLKGPVAKTGQADAQQEQQPTASQTRPEQEMTQQTLEQRKNSAERLNGVIGVSGPVRKVASPWMGWSLLSNPFRSGPRPGKGPEPVQGELALDMIKPVRNDLSDADLEIIPATRRSSVPERSQQATAREWKLVREPWWRRVWNKHWWSRRQT